MHRQPASQVVAEGQRAEFSISATGDGLKYQWYIDRNDGRGWQELDGANGPAYTTSVTDKDCDGFRYICVVRDQYGNVIRSGEAALYVTVPSQLPETGDPSAPVLWFAMSALSLLGILFLRRKAQFR